MVPESHQSNYQARRSVHRRVPRRDGVAPTPRAISHVARAAPHGVALTIIRSAAPTSTHPFEAVRSRLSTRGAPARPGAPREQRGHPSVRLNLEPAFRRTCRLW